MIINLYFSESNGEFPTGILQLPKQLFWDTGGKKKKKRFYFIKQNQKWHTEPWRDIQFGSIFKGQKYCLVIKNSTSTCLKFCRREFGPLLFWELIGNREAFSETKISNNDAKHHNAPVLSAMDTCLVMRHIWQIHPGTESTKSLSVSSLFLPFSQLLTGSLQMQLES